jgi:hypothetical protein
VRPLNVVVGAAAFVLALYVAVESAPFRPVIYVQADGASLPDGGPDAAGTGDAGSSGSATATAASSAGGARDAFDSFGGDGGLAIGDLPLPVVAEGAGGDGGSLALGAGAPRGVRFGVILVAYDGVETLNGDHPPHRSKAEAKTLADKLDEDAKSDFHGAVQRGDNGSSDDVGRVPRGVLDANTEYALFSLPVGGISAVVDTPRGFWIAKRLE